MFVAQATTTHGLEGFCCNRQVTGSEILNNAGFWGFAAPWASRDRRYQESRQEWLEWLWRNRGLVRPEWVSLEEVSITALRIRGMLPASQRRQEREAAPLFGAHGMTVQW